MAEELSAQSVHPPTHRAMAEAHSAHTSLALGWVGGTGFTPAAFSDLLYGVKAASNSSPLPHPLGFWQQVPAELLLPGQHKHHGTSLALMAQALAGDKSGFWREGFALSDADGCGIRIELHLNISSATVG